MSTNGLAVAAKDVSSNPSKGAVTAPVVPKEQAKDVDRKMRLVGVIEAFRKGNYPSNGQIHETLDWLVKHGSPIDESQLSSEGRQLVQDSRRIIETANELVQKKNEDELFQNFLWHTRKADTKGSINPSLGKDDAQRHAEESGEHLQTLLKLIITNSEFRKILKDLSYLAGDVAADAAQKAANEVRPADHKLNQIDETAGDARWVTPDGQERGPNEAVPDTGVGKLRDQAVDAKNQAADKAQEAKQTAQAHADDVASTAQNADNQPGADPANAAQGHAEQKANVAADKAESKLNEKTDADPNANPRDKVIGLVPEQHRERADQAIDDLKSYAQEKFPEERQDKFIYRLKKVVVELQSHRDYNKSIEYWLHVIEQYQGAGKQVAAQADGAVAETRDQGPAKSAERELRTLLERFANNQSMDPIFKAVDQLYTDAKNDEHLRSWFSRADSYIRRVLQEPGYVMKDSCNVEGRKLRDDADGLFNKKYEGHRQELFESIKNFATSFAEDPLNKRFGEDWKRLVKDLLLDGDGNLKYKSHLWEDLRSVILPTFLNKAGYIPIPRIEYTDVDVDMVIENLTIASANLLPNVFEIEAKNYFKLSPYKSIKDQSKHSVWIQFSQMQADIRDVAYYIKKKHGFPKVHDSGLADVLISGAGITGKVHLETARHKADFFDVREVKVKIDKLSFKVRSSNHSVLTALARPLANNLIKKAITKAAEMGIRSALGELNSQLVELRDEFEEASKSDDKTRTDVLKSKLNSGKEKSEEAKEKADKRQSQFRVVLSPEDKINDWESKGSLIGRQAVVQERAGQGKEWRSPAFDIIGKTAQKPTA